jgi:transposase
LSKTYGNVQRVTATATPLPDLENLDKTALKALVVEQHTEIENLKLLVLKFKRMTFGHSSEKLDRNIEQLELKLEEMEAAQVAMNDARRATSPVVSHKSTRTPLPEHLPREIQRHAPKHETCPDCGGTLSGLGQDIAEMLEYVPAQWKVVRIVRPKLACSACDRILQEPAPHRPIARGLAGPGLLAHVLVSKYGDHLPLYRQSEIYEREGVELSRSTLADWVGSATETLGPLVEAIERHVLAASKLHGDDIPVPVLAPGAGKTKTGRLWTYVRDDRPSGSTEPPAVWFQYSPDRKSEHPARHLETFRGVLQADGFAGFNRLYETGRITEAACWAHARRKFFDLYEAHASPIAKEALDKIGTLYDIERADSWAACRGTAAHSNRTGAAIVGIVTSVDEGIAFEAFPKIRRVGGHPLCIGPLGAVNPLLQ